LFPTIGHKWSLETMRWVWEIYVRTDSTFVAVTGTILQEVKDAWNRRAM